MVKVYSITMHGLLVLDKPLGMTSRDVVNRAQRWFPRGTRIGHTGTLDPLATGVLVLTVGHATRLTEYVQDMGKTYVADVELGATSATDDAEGPVTPVAVAVPPGRDAVNEALATFVGTIEQVPSAFSAVKVAGRRAYDLARQGSAVELAPRTVRIDGIDVLAYDYPHLRLEVRCGKGTYIRSLARDLGERLGCGGYLTGLRRTRVGQFAPEQGIPLDAVDVGNLRPLVEAVAALPQIGVSSVDAARLRHGQRIVATAAAAPEVAVLDPVGALVAIVESDGHTLRPLKVIPA
ncbi:MAG: tRNA pseudouridine(55) synthase TruB [Gemmataceae bacterium]